MFTSRSEYRLKLRPDNADQRLTGKAIDLGGVSAQRVTSFAQKKADMATAHRLLNNLRASPNELAKYGMNVKHDGVVRSALELMSFPDLGQKSLANIWPQLLNMSTDIYRQIETETRYESYLQRQAADIDAFRKDEELLLPPELDYGNIGGLSTEARHKLQQFSPSTLGAASRISGVTPAAITALLRHVKRRSTPDAGSALASTPD
jgi:tRNA uridine 5-carboxymethylaminomethyl modification enzyme